MRASTFSEFFSHVVLDCHRGPWEARARCRKCEAAREQIILYGHGLSDFEALEELHGALFVHIREHDQAGT